MGMQDSCRPLSHMSQILWHPYFPHPYCLHPYLQHPYTFDTTTVCCFSLSQNLSRFNHRGVMFLAYELFNCLSWLTGRSYELYRLISLATYTCCKRVDVFLQDGAWSNCLYFVTVDIMPTGVEPVFFHEWHTYKMILHMYLFCVKIVVPP